MYAAAGYVVDEVADAVTGARAGHRRSHQAPLTLLRHDGPVSGGPGDADGNRPNAWSDERTANAAARAELAERAMARETAQAQRLVDAFVAEARRARASSPTRCSRPGRDLARRRYRTGLLGWYLSRDERVAVDTEGRYYVLRAQGTLRERLTGAHVEPMDPPLVVGRGGARRRVHRPRPAAPAAPRRGRLTPGLSGTSASARTDEVAAGAGGPART